jgi:ribosomal-protein-alanine N-acetyltransferase
MTVRDLDAVVSVEVQAYSFPWSRGNFIDSLAAGYLAEVLLSTEGLVGYFVAMPGVDELHLLNLTVAPDWQRQGHGRALLGAVQDQAQERRLATLWLEVRESNLPALALYRQHGFAEAGRRRGYYPGAGRREDAVVMSMTLAPRGSGDGVD